MLQPSDSNRRLAIQSRELSFLFLSGCAVSQFLRVFPYPEALQIPQSRGLWMFYNISMVEKIIAHG